MRTFQRVMLSAVACFSLMAATGCDERAVVLFVSGTTPFGALDDDAISGNLKRHVGATVGTTEGSGLSDCKGLPTSLISEQQREAFRDHEDGDGYHVKPGSRRTDPIVRPTGGH